MQLNDVFPSKYVKAADLKGREVAVVISNVAIEKMGDDRKLVVYFQGKEKGLVTNKTNANRIAYLYGDDTDGWIGKEIILATELVDFQGKTVEAIRVRPPVRRAAPAPQQRAPQNGKNEFRETNGVTIMETKRQPPRDALEEVLPERDSDPLSDPIPF